MSYTPITTKNELEYRVRIVADIDAESPRNWENLGIMLCGHKRYELGDEQLDSNCFASWNEVHEYIEKELGGIAILPLYLYDHGGITMSTGRFSCRWDSGQVGFIYTTSARVSQMFGITDVPFEKIEESLNSEVVIYDQFLTGDVYGFIIEKRQRCEKYNRCDWEHDDSCYGFYGRNPKENGMAAHIPDHLMQMAIDAAEGRGT